MLRKVNGGKLPFISLIERHSQYWGWPAGTASIKPSLLEAALGFPLQILVLAGKMSTCSLVQWPYT